MQRLELAGQRFGRLVVVELHGVRNGCAIWRCKCDCGKETLTKGSLLRNGKTKSCGCLREEVRRTSTRKHGLSNYRPYYVWKDIKRRCYDETATGYKNYGGRGISMCDEWKDNVMAFCDWAHTSGYQRGMSIDRIDNDGNYEPANCVWKTMKEQGNNKRTNHIVEIGGIKRTLSEWADFAGIAYGTVYARVEKGYSGEEIIKPIEAKYRNGNAKK